MTSQQKKTQHTYAIICLIILISYSILASQVFGPSPSLDTLNPSSEAFNLKNELNSRTTDKWNIVWKVNVNNATFNLMEDYLNLSADRGFDDSYSLSEVDIEKYIMLMPDLILSYNIWVSDLDLYKDSAYVFLRLTNGTYTTFIRYSIGVVEKDYILPQQNQTYLFFKAGNRTNEWIHLKRNVQEDLAGSNLTLGPSRWQINLIDIGMKAYEGEAGHKMSMTLNASDFTLFYENGSSIALFPSKEKFNSWALVGMFADLFLFVIVTSVFVRKERREQLC